LQICTTLCVHSLYSYWRDEKSVVRSLQELSQTTNVSSTFPLCGGGSGHSGLIAGGEFEKQPPPAQLTSAYFNSGFHGSQHHINTASSMAITKYSGDQG
jgi:hypothetical protein